MALIICALSAPAQPREFDVLNAIRDLRAQPGAPAKLALARAYYLARQYRLFERTLLELIAADPAAPEPHFLLGRYQDSVLNDFRAAAQSFRAVLAAQPHRAEARYYLGNALEALGQTAEARAEYERSAAFPLSRNGLARLDLAAEKPAEALARNPPDPKLRARILLRLDRPAEAIPALTEAAAQDSTDASVHYQLYRAHTSLGHRAQAAQALETFKRLSAIYGSN